MNKTTYKNMFLLVGMLFISACSGVKNIAYFEKSDNKTKLSVNTSPTSGLFDARIKPKDMLSITVVSSEPEASRIYNLVTPQTETSADAG